MADKQLLIELGLDSTSFEKNTKRVRDLTKNLENDFNLFSSSVDKVENNFDSLSKKSEMLNKKMKLTSASVELFSQRLEESQKAAKENEKTIESFKDKISGLKKELKNVDTSSDLGKSLTKELKSYEQQLAKAEKAQESYNNRIYTSEQAYKKAQIEIQGMVKEITTMTLKMSKMKSDAKIDALTQDISELDHQFSLTKSTVSNFDNSMEGLQATQDHYSKRTELCTQKLDLYNKEIKESTEAIEIYEKEVDKLGKELKEWEEILQSLDATDPHFDETRKQVESLRKSFTEANTVVEFHKERLGNLNKEYNSTEKEIASMAGTLDKTSSKMQKMRDSLNFTPAKNEVDELSNSISNKLNKNLSSLQHELQYVQTRVGNYEKSLTGLTAEQKNVATALVLTQEKLNLYKKEMKELGNTIPQLANKQKELSQEIQKQIDISKKLTGKEWDKQRESVEKLKKEYKETTDNLEKHQKKLDSVEKEYSETRMQVAKLGNELDKVNSKVANFNFDSAMEKQRAAITKTTQAMSLLESKYDVARSKQQSFGQGTKNLALQHEELSAKISLSKQQMSNYESSISSLENEITMLTNKHKNLEKSIENVKNTMKNLNLGSEQYRECTVELTRLETEMSETCSKLNNFQSELTETQTKLNQTTAETNELIRTQKTLNSTFTGNNLISFGNGLTSLGSGITSVGASMMGLSVAGTAFGTAAINTAKNFESSMSQVRAITGATQEEFEAMSNASREMAKVTSYEANEAAQALSYLGLAGYDAGQAIDTLPKILALGQASAMDLAQSADLATDAIASLGYVGTDAVAALPDYLDKVAVTSTSSNTSIQQLLDSFIKVGGQLKVMDIELDQSCAMLGILANRGIKGSEAGNALNSILINMTTASGQSAEAMETLSKKIGLTSNMAFDANGDIRDVEEIFLDLARALSLCSTEQEKIQLINAIGGKTQAKTLQKLMQGVIDDTGNLTKEYKDLKAEIEKAPNTDALQNMASTMTDNLQGDLDRLKSAVSEGFLSIKDGLNDELRELVQNITEIVNKLVEGFKNLSPEMQLFIIKAGAMATVLPPITMAIGGTIMALGSITKALGGAVKWIGSFVGTGTEATGVAGMLGSSFEICGVSISGIALASTVAIGALVGIMGVIGESETTLAWLIDTWGEFGAVVASTCEWVAGVIQMTFGNIYILCKGLVKSVKAIFTKDKVSDVWAETLAEVESNTNKAYSNMTRSSTKALKEIRNSTTEELRGVSTAFETFGRELPNVTADNLSAMADSFVGSVSKMDEDTINILRGTSDTFSLILKGISADMDETKLGEKLTSNLNTALKAGLLESNKISKDFSKAQDLIAQNMEGSFKRSSKTAESVIYELNNTTTQGLSKVSQNIAKIVEDADAKTMENLNNMGSSWTNIFRGLEDTTNLSTQQIATIIQQNLADMGMDTSEGIKATLETVQNEFNKTKMSTQDSLTGIRENFSLLTTDISFMSQAVAGVTQENIDATADTLLTGLQTMSTAAIEDLKQNSDSWSLLLNNVSSDADLSSTEIRQAILGNLALVTTKTPEELATYVSHLEIGLNDAKERAKQISEETAFEISDMVLAVSSLNESNLEEVAAGLVNNLRNLSETSIADLQANSNSWNTLLQGVASNADFTSADTKNAILNNLRLLNQMTPSELQTYASHLEIGFNDAKSRGTTATEKMSGEVVDKVSKMTTSINKQLDNIETENLTIEVKDASSGFDILGAKSLGSVSKSVTSTTKETDKLDKSVTESSKKVEKLNSSSTSKVSTELGNTKNKADELTRSVNEAINKFSNLNGKSLYNIRNEIYKTVSALSDLINHSRSANQAVHSVTREAMPRPSTDEVQQDLAAYNDVTFASTRVDMRDFMSSGSYFNQNSSPIKSSSDNLILSQSAQIQELRNNNKLQAQTLEVMQNLLVAIVKGQQIDINIDGKKVAKASASYMQKEIQNISKRKTRLGGAY